MRLTYQTGIAALIHLGVITFLNILNGIHSSYEQCTTSASNDCPGDIVLAMLYFMLITLWFTALWILAAAAQTKRSRKLAFALICGEAAVIVVALFNTRGGGNFLELTTSVADAVLAAWVAFLAVRLFISGGGRVTGSSRTRRRRLSD